jgi:Ala-tRNA(Pro) deacylase
MAMAKTLEKYLSSKETKYELFWHDREVETARIAQNMHIKGGQLAKSVLLVTNHGPLLAVVPSTCNVDLARISSITGDDIELANDETISTIFSDCNVGAIPACGEAYNLPVFVDDHLADEQEIYFEAGDHKNLVHVSALEFDRMMPTAEIVSIVTQ